MLEPLHPRATSQRSHYLKMTDNSSQTLDTVCASKVGRKLMGACSSHVKVKQSRETC